jgi:hypothetical protein
MRSRDKACCLPCLNLPFTPYKPVQNTTQILTTCYVPLTKCATYTHLKLFIFLWKCQLWTSLLAHFPLKLWHNIQDCNTVLCISWAYHPHFPVLYKFSHCITHVLTLACCLPSYETATCPA